MKTQKRRPKGEGSIIKLPNGNYKATITIGKGIDGRQKRKSITRRTRAEVLEAIMFGSSMVVSAPLVQ